MKFILINKLPTVSISDTFRVTSYRMWIEIEKIHELFLLQFRRIVSIKYGENIKKK